MNVSTAVAAVNALHGRWFAGSRIFYKNLTWSLFLKFELEFKLFFRQGDHSGLRACRQLSQPVPR